MLDNGQPSKDGKAVTMPETVGGIPLIWSVHPSGSTGMTLSAKYVQLDKEYRHLVDPLGAGDR